MIFLKPITEENYREVLNLSVHKEQENFVMSVERSLAVAYVYNSCVFPFAIYFKDRLIGFIMCRYNKEVSNYFIWQFQIDKRFQNKGYGKASIQELINWISAKGRVKEIVTTVSTGNNIAKKLYEDIGFNPMNSNLEDEIDLIYIIEK